MWSTVYFFFVQARYNDYKSYEYEVSLIDIHIIFIYIYIYLIWINYILYKNMLISKSAVKNYGDLNILILKFVLKIFTLKVLWLTV